MNWGNKIAVLYIGFIIMIGFLVYKSTLQNTDLVSDDYYKKEIAYQQIIDANANNKTLATKPLITHNEKFIHIQFPSTLHHQMITGTIELYNAANAKNDTSISFSTSNDSVSIALKNIKKGNYTAKIQYASERINYYSETPLNLFE
jgi:hypothetical protein